MRTMILTAAAAAFAAGASSAAPVTFFGENLSPSATVSGDPVTARTNFLAGLTTASTEDFENVTLPNISFTGSAGTINATLNGGSLTSGGLGRFPTSGTNQIELNDSGSFSIDFGTSIAAFGFYGTDIGDIGNSLALELTAVGGAKSTLNVGNSTSAPDGSLLFFGFIDSTTSYTSVRFTNVGGLGDFFGFDDLTVGDVGQIAPPPPGPSAVPLPAAGLLLIGGLAGMGALRARRKG